MVETFFVQPVFLVYKTSSVFFTNPWRRFGKCSEILLIGLIGLGGSYFQLTPFW